MWLFQFYLERLHGARTQYQLHDEPGVRFPLIVNTAAWQAELRPGLSLQEVRGMLNIDGIHQGDVKGTSSSSPPLYAWTSFGWARPQFWFENDRLISMNLMGASSEQPATFTLMFESLEAVLGPPYTLPTGLKLRMAWLLSQISSQTLAEWRYEWGRVRLKTDTADAIEVIEVSWTNGA